MLCALAALAVASHYYPSDGAELTAAAAAAAAEPGAQTMSVLVAREAPYCVGDLTIPRGMTLSIQPGAMIYVCEGSTVAVLGDIIAGRHQIFGGSGSVDMTGSLVTAVYPEWWQPPGDTDWTASLQAAMDTDLRVELAATTYRIGAPLDGFGWLGTIVGQGHHRAADYGVDDARSSIEATAAMDAILSMVHPTVPQGTRTRIEGVRLACEGLAQVGIDSRYYSVDLHRVVIRDCPVAGLLLDDSYYTRLEYCDLSFNGAGLQSGSSANAIWIENTRFKRNTIGIHLDQAGYNQFSILANAFINNHQAIMVAPVDGNGLQITGNYFEDNGRHARIGEKNVIWIENDGDAVTHVAKNLVIRDNAGGGGPHEYWIRMEGCRNCEIAGNKIFNDDGGPLGYIGPMVRGLRLERNTAGTGMDRRFKIDASATVYGYLEDTSYGTQSMDAWHSSRHNLIRDGQFINGVSQWSGAVGLAMATHAPGVMRVSGGGSAWNYVSHTVPGHYAFDGLPLWVAVDVSGMQSDASQVIVRLGGCGSAAVRIQGDLRPGHNFFASLPIDYAIACGGTVSSAEIRIVPDADSGTGWIDVDSVAFGTGLMPQAAGVVTENGGISEHDGGGSSFMIAHGLPAEPVRWSVTAASADAAVVHHVTATSTHLVVATKADTPGGENNIRWSWGASILDY